MKSCEYFPDGEILIARQAVEPELARKLTTEWEIHRGAYILTSDGASPTPVETSILSITNLIQESTVAKISKFIFGNRKPSCNVAMNRQHPGSFQSFHSDDKSNPIAVVHGSDDGAFDYVILGANPRPYDNHQPNIDVTPPPTLYAPEAKDIRTIEVNAGDILFQLTPKLVHRGRNLDNKIRINIALYSN